MFIFFGGDSSWTYSESADILPAQVCSRHKEEHGLFSRHIPAFLLVSLETRGQWVLSSPSAGGSHGGLGPWEGWCWRWVWRKQDRGWLGGGWGRGDDSQNGSRDKDRQGVVFMGCWEDSEPTGSGLGLNGASHSLLIARNLFVFLCPPPEYSQYDWRYVVYQMNSVGCWVFPFFITHFVLSFATQRWPISVPDHEVPVHTHTHTNPAWYFT